MLPQIDGLSVLRHIRLEDERVPILILSAKGDSEHRVKGFAYGVDDYLAKPFNLDEFLLRIKRLLTRGSWSRESADSNGGGISSIPRIYRFGGNTVDFETLRAHGSSGWIGLTEQEARLLKLFVANRGKPLSRSKLLEIGWGYSRVPPPEPWTISLSGFGSILKSIPKNPSISKASDRWDMSSTTTQTRVADHSRILGIDVGSVSLSVVEIGLKREIFKTAYRFHHGDVRGALREAVRDFDLGQSAG